MTGVSSTGREFLRRGSPPPGTLSPCHTTATPSTPDSGAHRRPHRRRAGDSGRPHRHTRALRRLAWCPRRRTGSSRRQTGAPGRLAWCLRRRIWLLGRLAWCLRRRIWPLRRRTRCPRRFTWRSRQPVRLAHRSARRAADPQPPCGSRPNSRGGSPVALSRDGSRTEVSHRTAPTESVASAYVSLSGPTPATPPTRQCGVAGHLLT